MTDWTSKWRETRQKSKKSKKEPQNEVDVKATKMQAEVQSGREIPTE